MPTKTTIRRMVIITATMAILLLGDLAYIHFRIASFDSRSHLGDVFETPTVATFGYNNLRSGAVQSSLNAASYTPLTVHDLLSTQGDSLTMPLYLNGNQTQLPGFRGRKIIYFGSNYHFNAFDIEENKIIWSRKLPLPEVDQTPVIDSRRGKIYFTASGKTGEEAPAAWARSRLRIKLFSANLDGSELRGVEVDLDKLVYPDQRGGAVNPSHVMRCRTALGLNDHANAHYVFWGCGMNSRAAPYHYGNLRGARGVLIAAYLDDSGELVEPNTFAAYSPSAMTSNPGTGFDSGIWNSGAGPSLLHDNFLLVATGNGPFIPAEANYGCSVISLDGEQLVPRSKSAGRQPFYSLDNRGYNECHVSNMDLGSSSVATIQTRGRFYSAIVGKDGHLKVFNPYDLPGDDPMRKSEVLIGRVIFGQPTMLLDRNGEVQTVAGGGQLSYPFYRGGADYVTATQAQMELLEGRGYRRGLCLGLISKYKKGNRLELVLHDSGHLRNDLVVLPMGTTIQALISAGEFAYADWIEAVAANQTGKTGPYKSLQTVGYALDPDIDRAPPGYIFTPLKIYASRRGGLYSFPEALHSNRAYKLRSRAPKNYKGELLKGLTAFPDEYGSILHTGSLDPDGFCGTNQDTRFERLYLFVLPEKDDLTGWAINSFNISENYQLTKKWTYLRDDGTSYPPSNMVTTFSENGDPGLVIFPIERSGSSYLVLLNSETGKLVDQIAFKGRVSFTMPLVVDEKIYLATSEGIKVFRRSESFLELARRFSILWNLSIH